MVLKSDSKCPDRNELEKLLDHLNPVDADESIVDHLGECPDCQSRLEDIASGHTDWKDWETVIKSDRVWSKKKDSPTTTESDLPSIPGYEVLSVLGEGGMGIVYKARQENLHRFVALKRMRASWRKEKDFAKRFEEEAKALGQLQHPNLVQIYDVFEHQKSPYLVLEFVDGGTLADRLSRETMSSRDAARLMLDATRAIEFTHQKGILHRDLKPANLLLHDPGGTATDATHEGSTLSQLKANTDRVAPATDSSLRKLPQVKVTDFGLARQIDNPSNRTETGDVMGTPNYMPPEQACGDRNWSSTAVDIYALGAVLYECITGRPPFRGETAVATINQLLTEDPVRPSTLSRDVPRDLETICLKCLSKKPSDRYRSAAEMAEDLQRFLDGKPILAKRSPFWVQATKWVKRQPVTATLVTSTVVAASILLFVWYQFTIDLQKANGDLAEQTQKTNWENIMARKAAVEANQRLEEAAHILTAHADLLRDAPELASPAMRPLRNRLIQQTLDSFQSLAEELNKAGKVPMESATYARMSQLYRELGNLDESIDSLEKAIELRRLGDHEFNYDPAFDSSLAVYLIDYSSALELTGLNEPSESAINESINILNKANLIPSMPNADRLYRLAAAQKAYTKLLLKDPMRREELRRQLLDAAANISEAIKLETSNEKMTPLNYLMAVTIYRNLGSFWEQESELKEAQRAFAKAVEYGKELDGQDPHNNLNRHYLATVYCYQASIERQLGNLDASQKLFVSARAMRETLRREAPYDNRHLKELAKIETAIARLLFKQRKPEECILFCLSSAQNYLELVKRTPGETGHLTALAEILELGIQVTGEKHEPFIQTLRAAKPLIEPAALKNPSFKKLAEPVLKHLATIDAQSK